jgi:hypothetical protein
LFIINLVIIIVTNDNPFRNNDYRFYVFQDWIHNPLHKDEMDVHYRFDYGGEIGPSSSHPPPFDSSPLAHSQNDEDNEESGEENEDDE